METTIQAIYDGTSFKPLTPILVKGKYEVEIIFKKQLDEKEEKIKNLEKCFGIWTEEEGNIMAEIIKERSNFSKNRRDIDFS